MLKEISHHHIAYINSYEAKLKFILGLWQTFYIKDVFAVY